MKHLKIYITLVGIITLIFLFSDVSFSWRLFDILTSSGTTAETAKWISEFNPESDLLFLPPLGNKPFFDAVDDLSICRNGEVRKFIYLYLTAGRPYVTAAIGRSGPYVDMLREKVRECGGVPEDIALLPLLESGFNPMAVSRSNAVGLWQFLGGTSRMLGLRSDKWVDERRDLDKSTEAAVRHLKNLYSIFNCWDLTLAAYNGGAGYVKRAMLRTHRSSFCELQKAGVLRAETSEYVARYAALMVIYKNQELFGIADEVKMESSGEIERLVLEYPANIRTISEISGVPLETIRKLNPALKTNLTPPYVKNYVLRLPAEAKKILESGEAGLYAVKFSSIKKHLVKRGECLGAISKRYNTTPRMIMLLNDMQDPQKVKPGQLLYIPI